MDNTKQAPITDTIDIGVEENISSIEYCNNIFIKAKIAAETTPIEEEDI